MNSPRPDKRIRSYDTDDASQWSSPWVPRRGLARRVRFADAAVGSQADAAVGSQADAAVRSQADAAVGSQADAAVGSQVLYSLAELEARGDSLVADRETSLEFVPQASPPAFNPLNLDFDDDSLYFDLAPPQPGPGLDELLHDRATSRVLTEPGSRTSPMAVHTLSDLVSLLHSKDHVWEFLVWFGTVLEDRRARHLRSRTHRRDEDQIDIDIESFHRFTDSLGDRLDRDTYRLLTQCASYLGEGSFNIVGKACLPGDMRATCPVESCVAVKISKLKNFDSRRSTVEFKIQDLLSKTTLLETFVPKIYQQSTIDYPIMGKTSSKVVQTMEIITPWTDPDLHVTVTTLADLIRSVENFAKDVDPNADPVARDTIKRLSYRLEYIFARIAEFFVIASIHFPGIRHNDLHAGNVLLTQARPDDLRGSLAWDATIQSVTAETSLTRLEVPRVVLSDWEFGHIPDVVPNSTIQQARIAVESDDGKTVVQWAGPFGGWMIRETRFISEMERLGRVPYHCDMADILRIISSYVNITSRVPLPRFRRFYELTTEPAYDLATTYSKSFSVWKCQWQWAIRKLQERGKIPTMTTALLDAYLDATTDDDLRELHATLPYDLRSLLRVDTLYGRSTDHWNAWPSSEERSVHRLIPVPVGSSS